MASPGRWGGVASVAVRAQPTMVLQIGLSLLILIDTLSSADISIPYAGAAVAIGLLTLLARIDTSPDPRLTPAWRDDE